MTSRPGGEGHLVLGLFYALLADMLLADFSMGAGLLLPSLELSYRE